MDIETIKNNIAKLGIFNQEVYFIAPFLLHNETHFKIRTGKLISVTITEDNELVFGFDSPCFETKIFERDFDEKFFFDKQEAYKKLRTIKNGWFTADEDD